MTPLESLQAIGLNLLFLPRSADHFNSGEILRGCAIAVQTDDRTDALVDLSLVSMGRGLDLAALVTVFDGRQHAAQPVDLAKLLQGPFLDGSLDDFHSG